MKEIKELLKLSLQDLYRLDRILLDRAIKEECINHRFAIYLENHFKKDNKKIFSVDVEYNRNVTFNELPHLVGFQPEKMVFNKKIIFSENENYKEVVPDIIIHERGSNRNNYLCLEAKKIYSSTKKRDKDLYKLVGLLNDPFNYQYACLLEYLPNGDYFYALLMYKENNGSIVTENYFISKDD